MTYPFGFQKWGRLALLDPGSVTYLLVKDEYVVAHLSCAYDYENHRGTLFHLFVDPSFSTTRICQKDYGLGGIRDQKTGYVNPMVTLTAPKRECQEFS